MSENAPTPSADDGTLVQSADAAARILAGASSGTIGVPGFEIESTLGRGGMGVVYKATQTGLNRVVALKMLIAGQYADPSARARFLLEAESVAALEHPHIIRVFAFGESGGHPYLAMEYVPGGTLAERVKASGPLPPTEATELLAKLAAAVAHAHSRGVVHRDIKPLNVLMTADGEPRLTDFGLAKVGRADQNLSVTGQVLGTPAYMSPEQAGGKVHEVGTAADVYALGAVLYDLLTGHPPFTGDSAAVTLQKVISEEPQRPRKLNALIPHDLETICLKCLEKEPAKRYPTAQALADDLLRYLRNEPISVRPAGRVERMAKWVRRNPTRATAVALGFLAATLGGFGGVAAWQWRKADMLSHKLARNEYARTMEIVRVEIESGSFGRAEELLATCPPEHRGWEWGHAYRLCHPEHVTIPHQGWVSHATFSTDGRRVMTTTTQNAVQVWDFESGQSLVSFSGPDIMRELVAFSPDGRKVVRIDQHGSGTDDDELLVVDVDSKKTLCRLGYAKDMVRLSFSSNGSRIAAIFSHIESQVVIPGRTTQTISRGVRVIDSGTGATVMEAKSSPFDLAALSPDGRRLATASSGSLVVWEVETGKNAVTFPKQTDPFSSISFSSDDRKLLTESLNDGTQVWDSVTGKRLAVAGGRRYNGHLSPDGNWVVSQWDQWDGNHCIWSSDTGVVTETFHAPVASRAAFAELGRAYSAFSPDGKKIVAGTADRVVRVWDLGAGGKNVDLRGHGEPVVAVAFSPDGRWVISGSRDKSARIWECTPGRKPITFEGHTNLISAGVQSADGSRLLTAAFDKSVRVWGTGTGRQLAEFHNPDDFGIQAIAFSSDGRRAAAVLPKAHAQGTATVWETDTGRQLFSQSVTGMWPPIAISEDGSRVATASDSGMTIRNLDTGESVTGFRSHAGPDKPRVVSLRFSPDGKHIVSSDDSGSVYRWETGTGRLREAVTMTRHTECKAVSPDGRRVVLDTAGVLQVWGIESHEKVSDLRGHTKPIITAAFSPDGRRVLTTSKDGTAGVWDTESGYEVWRFNFHKGPARRETSGTLLGASWSSDGNRIRCVVQDERKVRVEEYESTPTNRIFGTP